jgi:hypothetical protein
MEAYAGQGGLIGNAHAILPSAVCTCYGAERHLSTNLDSPRLKAGYKSCGAAAFNFCRAPSACLDNASLLQHLHFLRKRP